MWKIKLEFGHYWVQQPRQSETKWPKCASALTARMSLYSDSTRRKRLSSVYMRIRPAKQPGLLGQAVEVPTPRTDNQFPLDGRAPSGQENP